MGTKVHCKSYLPGYYTMGNPTKDLSGSWVAYCDKNSNGHLYDHQLMQNPVNEHFDDVHALKRTMLEHDAMFRKQVYELHRLYKVQMDLMKEQKMKVLHKNFIRTEASQSRLFQSQIPSESPSKMPLINHLPGENVTNMRIGISDPDDMKTPSNILKQNGAGTGPMSPVAKGSGILLKDGESTNSKATKVQKRMFDLELPAEVYIDGEDTEIAKNENIISSIKTEGPLDNNGDSLPKNGVKLSAGIGINPSSSEFGLQSCPHSQDVLSTERFADLNEPIHDSCVKEMIYPNSSNFVGPKIQNEVQLHLNETPSCIDFLGQERGLLKDSHGDKATSSNICNSNEKMKREWLTFNDEAGKSLNSSIYFSPNHHADALLVSLAKPENGYEYVPDQSRTNNLFGEKLTCGTESSELGACFAKSSYSRSTASQIGTHFSVPYPDYLNSPSPMVSTSRKPVSVISHVPIAVQALPCFTGSSAMLQSRNSKSTLPNQNLNNALDRCGNFELKSQPNSEVETSLHCNVVLSDSVLAPHLYPTPFTLGKLNLNKFGNSLAYGSTKIHGSQNGTNGLQLTAVKSATDTKDDLTQNRIQAGGGKTICNIDYKHGQCLGSTSWPRRKLPSSGSSDINYTMSSSCGIVAAEFERKRGREIITSTSIFPGSTSPSKERKLQGTEFSAGLNANRILSFPVSDLVQSMDLSHGIKECSVPRMSNTVGILSGTVAESLVAALESNAVTPLLPAKRSSGIDLEASITDLGEDSRLPESNSIQLDFYRKLLQMPSSRTDASQEKNCFIDPVRTAAENIIVLALKDRIRRPLPPVSCASLDWFANIASSIAESAGVPDGDGSGCCDNDGADFFESMTLKLQEIEEEEYAKWSGPIEREDPKEKEANVLLYTKPRRGQRRRRQRKDFQKDVLPGLVSLSRHEVNDDLQTIGGMMRAAGISWPMGLSRHGTGRNGSNGEGRGRRRTRNIAVRVGEHPICSLPTQTPSVKMATNGGSMVGWGRTPRRCRSQRHQSGTASALLT